MNATSPSSQSELDLPAPLRALLALESGTFLFASLLHLGSPISLGVAEVSEPRIIPATVVEGAIAFALGIAAFGAIRRRHWARTAGIAASGFSIAGVLLGITALALGAGPATPLNRVYHGVMLVVLAGTLAVLLWPTSSRGAQKVAGGDATGGNAHG